MDEDQEDASSPPPQLLQRITSDENNEATPSAAAATPVAPESATAGFQAAGLDLFLTSLAGANSIGSRSAPSSSSRRRSHSESEPRRLSASSVPAFERDDELLPPSAIAPDKRSFALDDLSSPAVFRVRPSSISANSPVYSSFEHPTPALDEPSSSFCGLPPSVADSFALAVPHPPSRASSAEDINFNPEDSDYPIATGSILTTATSTPERNSSARHCAIDSGEFGSVLESPPPFALPSSAASPLQYNVLISDSDHEAASASSFFTPETSSSFASTRLFTPVANPSLRGRHSGSVKIGSSSPPLVSLSPGSFNPPRSCEVYIGFFGEDPLLLRYAKWLHAELESHGVACFSADRALYADQRSHDIARAIMYAATFGVVLVARKSFRNPYAIEELTIFLDRGNLIPVFFDVAPADCLVRDIVEKQGEIWEEEGGELWKVYMGEEKGWAEAVKGLLTVEAFTIEAYKRNWRESIQRVVALVGFKLRRRSVTDMEKARRMLNKELPWPRNPYFAGREKELKLIQKLLFTEPCGHPIAEPGESTVSSRRRDASSKAETEDMDSSRPSNYDNENYEELAWNMQTGSGLKDASRRTRRASREKRRNSADRRGESDRTKYSPACTVTGIPGLGKSELALEYAYRHSQKYQMVLWVGGEARYLRQNYLNLSTILGVSVGTETSQPGMPRAFEDMESESVQKIRHELQKDVPYLLIIDNLDTFDARELSELLPRAGGASHVIITTRLPRVLRLACLELPYLSSFEALTLMRDGERSERSFSVQQIDKFKEFEDKLRRLPFGLAIVGRLINEFNMKPSEILAKMDTIDKKRVTSAIERDDVVLRSNPSLVKLLDLCFNLMGAKSLAVRMAYAGGWFAPTPCPLALLALVAKKLEKDGRAGGTSMLSSCYPRSTTNARTESDAFDLLTRLGVARAALRSDCDGLYFPDIIQVYCQKRGGVHAARAFVRVMHKRGNIVHHYDHFWAAAYLVCRYGSDASVVELQVPDLLDFTRRLVLPLAIRAFHLFSRCTAALEVLRLCYEMLEDVEKSYVAQIQDRWDRSLCWKRDADVPHQVDEYVWQDLTLLRALLLEARAKLLMRGGRYDVGEELCRTCISIRTVMLGADHSDTLAAQETLSKFIRNRSSSSALPLQDAHSQLD